MAFQRNRDSKNHNSNRKPMSVKIRFDIMDDNEKALKILDERIRKKQEMINGLTSLKKLINRIFPFKRQ